MDYYLDDDRYQDGLEYQEELDHGIRCPNCGEWVDSFDFSCERGLCVYCIAEEINPEDDDELSPG